ncbi:phosphatases II [Biscogniauxia mediterranea]|nr:phosphatases II [Biscogniauxia mediterranea]
MDQLSRFWRTKNSSPALSTAGRAAPPVLSISTAASTTPPSSSHSANSANSSANPPKSPFQSLHSLRSAHKRARSPTPSSSTPTSPAVVDHDAVVEHNTMSLATGESSNGNTKPRIPSFLTISLSEMDSKYAEINRREFERYQANRAIPNSRSLDRYMNVQPWFNNRIKLQVPEGENDYINASPIKLVSPLRPNDRPPHQYIAMQGPMPVTTPHVWRMVTEQLQSPAVIIMLTKPKERGSDKCFTYYPENVGDEPLEIGEDDEFGDGFRAQVTCKSVEKRAGGAIEIREINVHVEGKEEDMTVWHLFYTKWPDFDVPEVEDMDSLFELMRLSREKNASEDNPRIIHCSAGVGRTGTSITLELLMEAIESGDLEHYDQDKPAGTDADPVFDTVNSLREQRRMMVQQGVQYQFIYQVLRQKWMEKYGITDDDCTEHERAAKRLEVDHDPFIEN